MSRAVLFLTFVLLPCPALAGDPLRGTKPLTAEGDLAAQMVAGIDKYLMRELEASGKRREEHWTKAGKARKEDRETLQHALGLVDPRADAKEFEYIVAGKSSLAVAETPAYKVFAVRWPVLEGVDGEGLLLEPEGKVLASVIALPDADWTPEMVAGLAEGVPEKNQYARRLAENGCRVLVPVLIDRKDTWSGNAGVGRMTNQPHREFIYRMAFEMGRHPIGFEVQKVRAAVDVFLAQKSDCPVAVCGHGEGGAIALFSAAMVTRISTVSVSGYAGPNSEIWQEPIYRNLWRSQSDIGLDGLALLAEDTKVFIRPGAFPKVDGPPAEKPYRRGAAPGKLGPLSPGFLNAEAAPALALKNSRLSDRFHIADPAKEGDDSPSLMARDLFFAYHDADDLFLAAGKPTTDLRKNFDPAPRQKRQFDQLVNFTQRLLRDSGDRREETFWSKLDKSSLDKYQASTEPFRKQLWEEVIGKLPKPTEPMNPRSRPIYDEPKWKGYEVILDLYPDVFAYGILLLPKDLKEGEKRPVVVCQHGLEGRPADVCNPKEKSKYYNSFGAHLADKGYIVFAPQNPYIGQDKFRVLQRKANPLGLSLFSFIIRQHERILDWLAVQPFIDP